MEVSLCSYVRDGVGALRLALTKRDILAGNFVERNHQVVRRYSNRRGNATVDVFQERKPRLFRSPLDKSDIQDDQFVGVMHADKRRRMKEPLPRNFKDELIKVF